MKPIQGLFEDWVEPDIGMYYLACLSGIMNYDESFDNYRKAKGVFWSNNELGNMLFEMLQKMAETGLLEKDEQQYQFRWNKSFEGYWNKSDTKTG